MDHGSLTDEINLYGESPTQIACEKLALQKKPSHMKLGLRFETTEDAIEYLHSTHMLALAEEEKGNVTNVQMAHGYFNQVWCSDCKASDQDKVKAALILPKLDFLMLAGVRDIGFKAPEDTEPHSCDDGSTVGSVPVDPMASHHLTAVVQTILTEEKKMDAALRKVSNAIMLERQADKSRDLRDDPRIVELSSVHRPIFRALYAITRIIRRNLEYDC